MAITIATIVVGIDIITFVLVLLVSQNVGNEWKLVGIKGDACFGLVPCGTTLAPVRKTGCVGRFDNPACRYASRCGCLGFEKGSSSDGRRRAIIQIRRDNTQTINDTIAFGKFNIGRRKSSTTTDIQRVLIVDASR